MAQTIEQAVELYGIMMIDCMKRFRETNTPTVNFVKTIKWIKEHLYGITMNPRYATLVLWLRYNTPDLEEYATEIWDNFYRTT